VNAVNRSPVAPSTAPSRPTSSGAATRHPSGSGTGIGSASGREPAQAAEDECLHNSSALAFETPKPTTAPWSFSAYAGYLSKPRPLDASICWLAMQNEVDRSEGRKSASAYCPDYPDRLRLTAAATWSARVLPIESRASRAASEKPGSVRATRPSRIMHSSSAIGAIASTSSTLGSARR
jgi:hypothetical protein